MNSPYPTLLLLLLAQAAWSGTYRATYVGMANGRRGFPAVERFTLMVNPEAARRGLSPVWWEMTGYVGEESFSIRCLSRDVPLLGWREQGPEIVRYQLLAQGEPPLEYVNARTRKALLPVFDFHEHFLPRAARQGSVDETGFARSCDLLGHAYLLESVEPVEGTITGWPDAKRLVLDPGLLVGTARNVRDTELARVEHPKDYTYAEFVEHEYDEIIEAGINFVIVNRPQREWVRGRPLFYVYRQPVFPQEFYRSNYHGWLSFMDEPAVVLYDDHTVANFIRDVRDVSTVMRTRARAEYGRLSSMANLPRFEQGETIGGRKADPLRLIQKDVFYWDTINPAAYYELAEGGSGVVHEGRYNLEADSFMVKAIFGEGIGLSTDEMLLMHYAFLRGAARNFGKYWGTAIYGQADPAVSPRAVELAYDMGARILWFWTSDHDHHLPYPEQLALARHIRDHAAANPRADHDELIKAAKNVIAFPEGYVLDPFILWKFPSLSVDLPNHTGTSHRDVLRRGLAEAILCMRNGESFDFAIDAFDFNPVGYERVIRIGYDASVRETGPEKPKTPEVPRSISVEAIPETLSEPSLEGRPVVRAAFLETPPKNCGDMSDWEGATWYDLNPSWIGKENITGATDLSGRCAIAYDFENLYLAVRVKDDFHVQPYGGWLMWNGDCVQVGLDPLLDSTEEGYGPDDSEFGLTLHEDGGTEVWWWYSPHETGRREGVRFSARREGGITFYEVAIPAELLGPWNPQVTPLCGINIAVADADAAAILPTDQWVDITERGVGRKAALELTDSMVFRKRPDLFAVLKLDLPPSVLPDAVSLFLGKGRAAAKAGHPVNLSLSSHSPTRLAGELTIELTGDHGVELDSRVHISIPPGRAMQRLKIAAEGVPPGLYTLKAAVEADGKTVSRQEQVVFFW